ncbi:MAG: competence/damage-inducible protein A [Gemmatimonadales bacterium]
MNAPSTPIELVTIGTEILLGHTVDTNSAFLGGQLAALGFRVACRTSVPDDAGAIRDAVGQALDRSRLVITTGGLGPTSDDITKHVVAEMLGMPLQFEQEVWETLLARFSKLDRKPAASNRSQALVPVGGTVLPNRWGTAPGLWLEGPRGVVIMLPGVPHEMTRLMIHEVAPRLSSLAGSPVASRWLRTCGVAESTLAEAVAHLEGELAPLTLAYLPGVTGVDLRLTSWDAPAETAHARLDEGIASLHAVAGRWAWGTDDDDLAACVLDLARNAGASIAVAESCTGGLVAGRLTDIPGSSDVFLGGVIAYGYAAKEQLLGVPADMLRRHGAVSGEVAESMVRGVADRLGASTAVAITGIAGPGGGTPDKPLGTVWMAFVHRGRLTSRRVIFAGTRPEVRARAVATALMGLRQVLREAKSET